MLAWEGHAPCLARRSLPACGAAHHAIPPQHPALGEVSVETNPKDLREDVIALLEAQGVQRLSVGVQTFDDALLGEMLRLEKYGSRAQILERLQAAAGRFRTLNVDMIWHLPRQTEAMLVADIDTVLASPANQASFYPLMASRSSERRIARTLGRGSRGDKRAFYEPHRGPSVSRIQAAALRGADRPRAHGRGGRAAPVDARGDALRAARGAIAEDDEGWSLTRGGMFFWVQMMAAFFESVDEFREEMRRRIADELGDTTAEVRIPAIATPATIAGPASHAVESHRWSPSLPARSATRSTRTSTLSRPRNGSGPSSR